MIVIVIVICSLIPISFLWAKGIENMKDKYPDYKGNDFIDWGIDDTDNIM